MTTAAVPARRRAKLATYVGAGALAVLTLLSGLKLILTELGIPSALWREEVRVLGGAEQGSPLLPAATFAWLNIGKKEPALLFERYADCQLRQKQAVDDKDSQRLKQEQEACLAILNDLIKVSPANSSAWLERARLIFALTGPNEQFYQSLRMSFTTGLREGWLAARRLPVVLEAWELAPKDVIEAATADVITLTQSDRLVAALADIYVKSVPLQRTIISELVESRADQIGKQRFIDALQRIIEIRRSPNVPTKQTNSP